MAGGLIIFFLKLKGRSVTLLQLAIGTIAVFPLLGLLLHCPTADIAGLNAAYPDGLAAPLPLTHTHTHTHTHTLLLSLSL